MRELGIRVPAIASQSAPRIARLVFGLACCVVGVVWLGQGVGIIGGSFMTGEGIWAVFGAIAIIVGVLLLRGRRHAASEDDS
jgi:hypothetical protein